MTPEEQTLLSRIRVWGGMAISPADAETARCLEAKGEIVLMPSGSFLIALTAERAAMEQAWTEQTGGAQ